MRKFYFFTLFCMIYFAAKAQDESVINRINGVTVASKIYLKWDPSQNDGKGAFRYSIENADDWHNIDNDLIFNVKNAHKNAFKIYTEFYNPLQYSIKSTSVDLDDPAYQAINQFISNLPASSTASPTSQIPAKAPAFTLELADNKVSREIKKTILLNEWTYELTKVLDKNLIKATDAKGESYDMLVDQINQIIEADEFLFGKFIAYNVPDVATQQYTLNDWIKNGSEELFNVDNNYTNFTNKLTIANRVNKSLIQKKENAKKSIAKLISLLTTEYDKEVAPFILTSNNDDFKKYSASTAQLLAINSEQKIKDNDQAIEKYERFLEKLKKHSEKYKEVVCDSKGNNCNQYFEEYGGKLDWKSEKMKKYQFEVAKLDKNGVEIEKSNQKGEFVVGKKHALYPYISTGILYTNFSYPKYSITTINGRNEVAKVDDVDVNLRPSIFLNLLLANWDFVLPFFQIGATTGVDDAIFPVGVGITLGRNFSISGGAMLGYRKELDSLKVGNEVRDDAALQNDLTKKGVAALYFSINYNFIKK